LGSRRAAAADRDDLHLPATWSCRYEGESPLGCLSRCAEDQAPASAGWLAKLGLADSGDA